MRKLDLGCGYVKTPGTIGLDLAPLTPVDVVARLDTYALPFADSTFDALYLNDVVEHVPDTIKFMEELYRVIRPDGHIFIRVINWNSHYNAMDPTHVRTFDEHTFDFFGKFKDRLHYSTARYEVVSVDYQFNTSVQRWLRSKRLMHFLGQYLNNVLEGLHFDLRAQKPGPHEHPTDELPLLDILRCPHCLPEWKRATGPDPVLENLRGEWLICHQPGCQRKYPIVDHLPIMLEDEARRWLTVKADDLPAPPKERYQRQHIVQK